jgi:2-polyprenyl-3-methyl-5-hydroxy-6-metoxy-1,4-benzoquinol methylase
MDKTSFALKSILKSIAQRSNCPYCGSRDTCLMERKHYVLQLRRCRACHLCYRFPKDDTAENNIFYQEDYQQNTVTDLPPLAELPAHIANRFKDIGRDLTEHLKTIKSIAPVGKLLDYGSSWGYCVYQFQQAGYDAQGFEISRPRVEYGQKMLGVHLTSDIASLPDASFDVIYSAHCMEHIPNPDIPLRQFQRLLKPAGHLFIYVPNCAGEEAQRLGVAWGPMIGEKHVLALTPSFFDFNLPKYGFHLQFSSSPYNQPPREYNHADLQGEELLVIGVRI